MAEKNMTETETLAAALKEVTSRADQRALEHSDEIVKLKHERQNVQAENEHLKRQLSRVADLELLSDPLGRPITAPTYTELEERVKKLEVELVEKDSEASRIPILTFENKNFMDRNKELKAKILELEGGQGRSEKYEQLIGQMRRDNEQLRQQQDATDKSHFQGVVNEYIDKVKKDLREEGQTMLPYMEEYRRKYEEKSKQVQQLETERGKLLAELEQTKRQVDADKCSHLATKEDLEARVIAVERMLAEGGPPTITVARRAAPASPSKATVDFREVKLSKQQCVALRADIDSLKCEVEAMTPRAVKELSDNFDRIIEAAKRTKFPSQPLKKSDASEEENTLRTENVQLKYKLDMEQKANRQLKKTAITEAEKNLRSRETLTELYERCFEQKPVAQGSQRKRTASQKWTQSKKFHNDDGY